jgi:hypothetical protein
MPTLDRDNPYFSNPTLSGRPTYKLRVTNPNGVKKNVLFNVLREILQIDTNRSLDILNELSRAGSSIVCEGPKSLLERYRRELDNFFIVSDII